MRRLFMAGTIALACLSSHAEARVLTYRSTAPLRIVPARAHMADLVIAAAHRHGVPPALAYGVASVESGFNPHARNREAIGLMQIKVGTARDMGCHGSLRDPTANADCGARILAVLLRDSGGDWRRAAAHYNAGRFARGGAGTRYAARVLGRARRIAA